MMKTPRAVLFFVLLSTMAATVVARSPFDPANSDYAAWRPTLVHDGIMPSPQYKSAVARWIDASFDPQSPGEKTNEPTITVERQDHNILRLNESCMGNPIRIKDESFATGLGTHANSRLLVSLPEPATSFSAKVGIDNNTSTNGIHGSVQFAVAVDGTELVRTPTLKGSDPAFSLNVVFAKPVSRFTLIVDATSDGTSCDQADWADAVVVASSGKKYPLASSFARTPLRPELPFSFKYNGVSSREFLSKWTFGSKKLDGLHTEYTWTDPKTKLAVTATVRRFDDFAAADWVLRFKNEGKKNTGLIEDVQALDTTFELGLERQALAIHTLIGDSCSETSWLPTVHAIPASQSLELAPTGGRPSNGTFPFWNMTRTAGDETDASEGVFVALGWTGQWSARISHTDDYHTAARAGMMKIATVLYPGEEIRSPRVLLMPWKSNRMCAHVLFRRLLMFEYAPKTPDGAPVKLECFGQCFDRYYRKRPGWENYDSQVLFAKKLKEAGCTGYWFDAAWFPVGFPNGVGNWFSDKNNFPGGVEQLGDTLRQIGLKFILWFEPERVAPNTEIATKYPHYVFGGKAGGLYKLNDPEARKFLTELLLKRIKDYKLNFYRNDFNIDPLRFWQANDTPDRQGITEIRYVEGHYEMWNRLIKENPGLWIDNCASGGRRIDLETVAISIPLWRSDTCCRPGRSEWDQNQTLGIARYLPLFSSVAWDPSPYTFRSAANPGCIVQYNFLDDDYDPVETKRSIQEAAVYQKFWYGDFYPLSTATTDRTAFVAWQLHRPDLNAGLVYLFRRDQSPYFGRTLELQGLEPDAKYRVRIKADYSAGKTLELTGAQLGNYPIMVDAKRSACVVEYEKQ